MPWLIEGDGNAYTLDGFWVYAGIKCAILTDATSGACRVARPLIRRLGGAREENKKVRGRSWKDETVEGSRTRKHADPARVPRNINVAFQELKGEPVTTNFGPAATVAVHRRLPLPGPLL